MNQKTYSLLAAQEAEKLLGAPGTCSGEFEFTLPQPPLKECPDALELTYEYEKTEGVF